MDEPILILAVGAGVLVLGLLLVLRGRAGGSGSGAEVEASGVERGLRQLAALPQDSRERRELWLGLLQEHGRDVVLARWSDLPAAVRIGFLEEAAAGPGFEVDDVLALARPAMEDAEEVVARRAFKTYAYTVTHAFETRPAGFDPRVWLTSVAEDDHPDVSKLREGLGARLRQAAEAKGVSALVSQYRTQAFRNALPTPVRLDLAAPLAVEGGPELAAGTHAGTLGGTFDNAQDAVGEGWSFTLELAQTGRCLRATWDAVELLQEVLDATHDGCRASFEDAPKELRQALALAPFVGPLVAWGDGWDQHGPRVGGAPLALLGEQLLSALIAVAPEGGPSELLFLIYEGDVSAEEGEEPEELTPFLTRVPLARLFTADAVRVSSVSGA